MTPDPTPSSRGPWLARARTAVAVLLLVALLVGPPAVAIGLARASDPVTTLSSAALIVGWLLLVAALVLEVRDLVQAVRLGRSTPASAGSLRRPLRWLVASAAATLVGLGSPVAAGASPSEPVPELGTGATGGTAASPVAAQDAGPTPEPADEWQRAEPGDPDLPALADTPGEADESAEGTASDPGDISDSIDETTITTTDIVVEAGDNFWLLAERELTARWGRTPTTAEIAGYWLDYVEANRDRLLPPEEPDLIYPGQSLVAPTPPHDPAATGPPADSDDGAADGNEEGADGDDAEEGEDPVPDAPTDDTGSTGSTGSTGGADDTGDTDTDDTGSTGEVGGTDETGNVDGAENTAAVEDMESTDDSGDDPTPDELGLEGLPPGEELPPEIAAELEAGSLESLGEAEAEDPPPDSAADPEDPDGSTQPEGGHADESPPDGADGTDEDGTDDEAAAGPPEGRSTLDGTSAAASRAADGDASGESGEEASSSGIPALLPAGALVLAGALFLLHRRRRAQQRHRERGERPLPLQEDLADAEHELTSGAAGETARRVDAALRAAAAGSGPDGLPPFAWVETGPQATMLLLTSPEPAPEGFVLQDGGWLTTAPASELADLGTRSVTPAPTLVPIGATREGSEALIELESSGVVLLDGPDGKTAGLLRALALGATTSPWNEHGRSVLVAMDGELTDLPGVSQAGLDAALDHAEAHAERTGAALAAQGCLRTSQGRARGAGDAWQPLLVLSAVRPERPDQLRRLADLARLTHQGMCVVTLAPEDTSVPIGGRHLTIHDDGSMRVDGIDELVWPGLVDQAGAGSLVRLLDQATWRGADAFASADDDGGDSDSRDTGAGHGEEGSAAVPVPEGPVRLGIDQLLEDVDVLVRVLGEVEAVRSPGLPSEQKLISSRHKTLEAVTYMACRQEPVPAGDLEHALFSNSGRPADMVTTTMSAVRTLLGDDLAPPVDDTGAYLLPETVATDYDLFLELTARAEETDDAHRAAWFLTEALDLVRKEPFAGVGRMYAWVGQHRGVIVADVVDAAEELAEIRLALGDWRSAEWAARQGLEAFPAEERLYRLLMRIAHASGQGVEGVRRVFEELSDAVADPLHGVEPDDTLHNETVELLAELVGGSPSAAAPA